MKNSTIFECSYEVSSLYVSLQKRLGLYALLNLLQDAAWSHANSLGFGFDDSLKRNVFWVLTRQKIVMDHWPEWHETIDIKTWVRPVQRSFTYRDFEIYNRGRQIGQCTTSWLLLDGETRRPATRNLEDIDAFTRKDGALAMETPKISLLEGLETRAEFQVRNSDLDLNDHVNNTKYAQWILDSIPREWHRQFILHSYEVNFLAETLAQDVISIQSLPEKQEPLSEEWVQFQGHRKADNKTVFAARLQVSSVL